MIAMTRGPLPSRVYWTRRVIALAVVAGLVVAVVQLVALAADGPPSQPDRAAPMASEPSGTTAPSTNGPAGPDEPREGTKPDQGDRKRDRDPEPELAEPEGECIDRDIAVTPTARKTVGGSPVTFVLELRTILSAACTWEVSPQSLTVKITSGDDDIWSSQQCPRAIPKDDVVIRNSVSTEVEVTWSARRSDDGCTRLTDWAMPGWYHIEAAALAGEPSDLQFQLTVPDPEVVTETVKPDPKNGDKKNGDRNDHKKNDRRDRR